MTRNLFCRVLALLALITAAATAGAGTSADGDGQVRLSPDRVRASVGDKLTFDIALDFSMNPTTGGSILISWNPEIFAADGWTYGTSTIDDDPAQRGTPVFASGQLAGVRVASPTALNTPGILGTLTLVVLKKTCGWPVLMALDTRPWISAVDFQTQLNPIFGGAYAGAGDDICLATPANPSDAVMNGRCIGMRDLQQTNSCPHLTGWRESPLYEPLAQRPDLGIVVPLASHMAQYCLYQRTGFDDGNPSDCPALQEAADRAGHAITLQGAVMAVGAQGPLSDTLAPEFESHFFSQVGMPLGDLPSPSPAAKLWIVSLDTAPRSMVDPLASHGPVISRIISELTPISTAGDFNTLAMPFQCFDDEECIELCGLPDGCPAPLELGDGGFMGTPESVAAGLHAAIGLWAADNGAILRMVFNASLGWPGELNVIDGVPSIGYLAFVDALKEAACLGAPVIASAGNAGGGPLPSQGLLYPAAESLSNAPTLAECIELGYLPDADNFPPTGTDRPLVYAVGAVRADGTPLLARADAEPELVAYGDHATALTAFGEGVLTGSSVSSAVAAAAAGLVWSYDLNVAPHSVMDTLYASSQDLGREATTCAGGPPCQPVRRLSLCAALLAFCENGAPDCPMEAEVDCPDIHPVQLTLEDSVFDTLDAQFAAAQTIDISAHALQMAVDYDPVCNHDGKYSLYQAPGELPPLNPCPQDQFFDIQAEIWAKGQPEGQSCETCTIVERSPAKLYAEIRSDFGTEFTDPTLADATLICRDEATGAINAFRIDGSFQPGALLLLTGIDQTLCAGQDMMLAFSVADDLADTPVSINQPLYVIRHDTDTDGIPDFRDNCLEVENPAQRDSNGDGYGNYCDPDLNNDGVVNFLDLGIFKDAFLSTDPDADLDGSGSVNFFDLGIVKTFFFGPPGPSGTAP